MSNNKEPQPEEDRNVFHLYKVLAKSCDQEFHVYCDEWQALLGGCK
jgi:hypothetical protein